jgi:hypothetical protein
LSGGCGDRDLLRACVRQRQSAKERDTEDSSRFHSNPACWSVISFAMVIFCREGSVRAHRRGAQ